MANLLDLLLGTKGGWNPDVPQAGVRPGFGLGTAEAIAPPVRSPYQRTLDPGETRTPSQLQEMLAEVILAAGSAAVPGAGPRGQARKAPASRGRPVSMTVYHGTNRDFERFETQKRGAQTEAIGDWAGAYFSPNKSQAEGIARWSAQIAGGKPTVKKVRVTLKNPAEWGQFKTREEAEAAGYDGRVFRDMDGNITEVVAFHPEQIKTE